MEINVFVTTVVVLSLFAVILVSVSFACLWNASLGCLCNFVSWLWGCCLRRNMRAANVQPLPEVEQDPPASIVRIGRL